MAIGLGRWRVTSMGLGAALLVSACGSTANPSASDFPSDPDVEPSLPAVTVTVPPDQMVGEWRASPLPLGDAQVATISDACAASARSKLGEAEANLPTAVVDARGAGLVTAVLSDDDLAVLCFAHVDSTNAVAVDSVARL